MIERKEDDAALHLAHDVFTEAWRFYRRCLEAGLCRHASPGAWKRAADDMAETFQKFSGTSAETLARDLLGAMYVHFDRNS